MFVNLRFNIARKKPNLELQEFRIVNLLGLCWQQEVAARVELHFPLKAHQGVVEEVVVLLPRIQASAAAEEEVVEVVEAC